MLVKRFPPMIFAAMLLSIVGAGYTAKVTQAGLDAAIEGFAGIVVDVLVEA